jgi:hypothetical protein
MEESVTPEAVDYTGLGLAGSDSGNKKRRETFDAKVEDPAAEAPAAEAPAAKDPAVGAVTTEAKKTGLAGLTDEDYLTLGLNMLAGAGPRRGSPLQDLMSGLGTAGIATLGARKEREKLAMEKEKLAEDRLYRAGQTKYTEALAKSLDRPTEATRTLQELSDNPALQQVQARQMAFKNALSTIDDLYKIRSTAIDPDQAAAIDAKIAQYEKIVNMFMPKDMQTSTDAGVPTGVKVTRIAP